MNLPLLHGVAVAAWLVVLAAQAAIAIGAIVLTIGYFHLHGR